jgi:cell division protein ZapA (FtsZ GTPase activity inhibitor)
MDDNLKSLQVVIAGRPYPIKVKQGDEKAIQKVVDELNGKIKDFQLTYINKDKQDCLAMALLTYAVEYHKTIQGTPSTDSLSQKVQLIDDLLDDILK